MTFRNVGEKIRYCGTVICCCSIVVLLCGLLTLGAQAMQTRGAQTSATPASAGKKAAHPPRTHSTARHSRRKRPVEKKPEKPPYPSDIAAKPATLSLKDGKLTVQADNSDLSQILREVASVSGMTVNGITKSARIFGVYGPGNPRDVLTALLDGSGYNFVMIGATNDGAPRELLLTSKSSPGPSLTPGSPSVPGSAEPNATQPNATQSGAAVQQTNPVTSAPETAPDATPETTPEPEQELEDPQVREDAGPQEPQQDLQEQQDQPQDPQVSPQPDSQATPQ